MAARLGLRVACLGELGYDAFGEAVLEGLQQEGIDVSSVIVSPATRTPVAGVLVDAAAEPAYLGYPGSLRLQSLSDAWRDDIREASAVFADGWAETEGVVRIILEAFREAKAAERPVFFDPGPGNPALDNAWHKEAAALATVVLANEKEAIGLTGQADALAAGQALVASGPKLAVVKRDVAGCLLITDAQFEIAPGYPVPAVDATGAGDSLAAGVIFGYLNGLALSALGVLANAIGAAKVQKRGTGLNVPTRDEVAALLARFGEDPGLLG
jgi:ribokinase